MDLSIILPSIRPQNLIKVYDSLKRSCKKYTFEVIIVSPYLIPEELLKNPQITYLRTYSSPTIAIQQAALLARGSYLFPTVDDAIFEQDSIDIALDLFFNDQISPIDIINMYYIEGALNPETLEPIENKLTPFPEMYWYAGAHGILAEMPGINRNWKFSANFIIKSERFFWLGGLDCSFEYSNHPMMDFIFRAQVDGSSVTNCPTLAFKCSFIFENEGDHKPVHAASIGPDIENFRGIYNRKEGLDKNRIKLDYNNWKQYPNIWSMRFDPQNLKTTPNE